ncbi:MAG: HD domain-containing protein [Gemmatimonadetes bacterium]|nr:HD domain-containing protein [Gemmatimonadota bacterium]
MTETDQSEFGAPQLTPRFEEALSYAAELHRTQTRKGSSIPYIAHLMSVAALVLEDGGDEEEAIAALLHDALEDHPDKTSREEIRRRFGERVAAIVEHCTDTPPKWSGGLKPPWRGRKETYLRQIRCAPESSRVALADKLHNARSILRDHHEVGEQVWERFTASKEESLWFYRELVRAFRDAGVTGYLIEALDRTVTELERRSGAAG